MANTLITPSELAKESLAILHTNNVFSKGIDRQYSKEFAVSGGKIGSTINIREPNRGTVRKGAEMQTQDVQETYVPLTLTTQWGCDISFSTAELTLSLDEFSKRILAPRVARLASQMDQDGLQCAVTGNYPNGTGMTVSTRQVFSVVGTPGTTPGTGGGSATGLQQYNAPIVFLNAGMMLNNFATPVDSNRFAILNPAAHAVSASSLSGLFNSQADISDIWSKGYLGSGQGFHYGMDQNVYQLVLGSRTATGATLSSALTNSSNQVAITGAGTSTTVVAGDKFTIAGVYSVNPETQLSTGQLMQFVVTTAVTLNSSGAGTLTVFPTPKLVGTGVANGNVWTATGDFTGSSTGGGSSSAIVFVGAASTVSPQNIAYHRDFMTLGTADLEMPGGVDFSARENFEGTSMRIVRAYAIGTDQLPCRIDILGGFQVLRPELACLIAG